MVRVSAWTENHTALTFEAGSALSGGQYKCVAISASGSVNLVAASGGLQVDGVLYNKPGSGEAATVVVAGVAKVIAGAAITAGAMVASDSGGLAITAISGALQRAFGTCLVSCTAANAVVPVLLGSIKTYVTG